MSDFLLPFFFSLEWVGEWVNVLFCLFCFFDVFFSSSLSTSFFLSFSCYPYFPFSLLRRRRHLLLFFFCLRFLLFKSSVLLYSLFFLLYCLLLFLFLFSSCSSSLPPLLVFVYFLHVLFISSSSPPLSSSFSHSLSSILPLPPIPSPLILLSISSSFYSLTMFRFLSPSLLGFLHLRCLE